MEAWGYAAWDSDYAVDWFIDLFKRTELARRVEDTLNLDPEDKHKEIRAATYVLLAMGRPYERWCRRLV